MCSPFPLEQILSLSLLSAEVMNQQENIFPFITPSPFNAAAFEEKARQG